MDPIPASQHQPIGIQVNAAIRPTSVPFKRRLNFKKADWKRFSEELEQIKHIAPISSNYDQFAELVKKTGKIHIPRGCRVEYIPGLTKDSSELYEEYVTMFEEDPFFSEEADKVGKKVMESISRERRKTWHTLIETTDMSKNSKNAWSTTSKLRGDPKASSQQPKVTAD